MADINKTLKRAIDGPAPQHYSQQLGDFVVTSDVNPLPTQLTGSYVGYSNETKPTGKKGETFLELDTLDVYIHDGSKWVKIT